MTDLTYEPEEGVEVEVMEPSTLALATERASVDVQIATARAYPRSITEAKREATDLATMDEETAAECFYVLPRAGKRIEGPSVRLAEIMAYAWGHLRADTEIVAEDRTTVTARGTAFDLQKNVAVRVQVVRRITDKHGRKYPEDMIQMTKSAAMAVAYRNAVFKVIPHVYTQEIYQAARKASIGDASTLTTKRQAAVEWFEKAGVPESRLYELLEIKGPDDIGEDELIVLRGLTTALKDGETTVEQLLRRTDDGSSERTQTLNEELKARSEQAGPEPETDKEAPREESSEGAVEGDERSEAESGSDPEGSEPETPPPPEDDPAWADDLERAKARARNEGR